MSLSTPPSDFLNIFPKFSQEGRVQIKKLNKQTCQINYFDQLSEVGSMIQGKSGIKGYLMCSTMRNTQNIPKIVPF